MSGITQRFGPVVALDSVELTVQEGTIHAVVGENGAGKTTLMRILYGAQKPTAGKLEVGGKQVSFPNSKAAIEAGIGMVSQHYGIIAELSCLQNLILGAEGGAILRGKAAMVRAEELAARMGFEFDWNALASTLSPAKTQKLEILKLLWRNAKIMILDEPTAMLSPADSDALFESMEKLADDGATVLLVTHRLPEVLDYCSWVTVLRGGKQVADMPVRKTSAKELARLIVGSDLHPRVSGARQTSGDFAIKIQDVVYGASSADSSEAKLKSVNITVRTGEIVGVAGVDGSGQRELFQVITGIVHPKSGTVQFGTEDVTVSTTASRIEKGLRIIPEDRHAEGVVECWNLEENSSLGLQRLEPFGTKGRINVGARRRWAGHVAEKFKTRHGGLRNPMSSLSGGNQQRFVAARALEKDPKILLAFQPARGLDLGGTADVYSAIRDRVDAGAAAIVVSFDLDELLEYCDRIVVMNGGVTYEPKAEAAKDRIQIGQLMVGALEP